ncbi:hypothetical protein KFK09_018397 [Dendrobium nobile]|uniref:Uncharacterized protein n=1 Tax=Dendrobium nobile TaxID=94219 RepID=A0A8T3AVY3_DENNO|nr:hypothetical protein KFK09_018397 [Dendrobium nobile]
MLMIRSLRTQLGPWASRASFSTSAAAVEAERTIRDGYRNDWSKEEIKSIYDSPILDLVLHGVSLWISKLF